MEQEAMRLAALILLAGNSFCDVRRHEICPALTGVSFAAGLVMTVLRQTASPASFTASLLPGGVFLLFSFLTHGAVGAGDGFVLLSLSAFFDAETIAAITFGGLLLASVYAGGELLRGKRADRSFAFLPFLLGGYVLFLLADIM